MSCKCKNVIENFQGGVIPLSTTFLSPVYFSGDTYHSASIFSGGTNLLDIFCTQPCSADTNTFIVSGNLSGTTLTLIKNNLSTVSITGFTRGGSTFTGNTSGTCIDDLWVDNVHGCSPITIHNSIKSPTGTILNDFSGFSFSYGTDVITKNSNSVALGVNTSAGYYQPYSANTGTVVSGGTILYNDDYETYNLFFPGVDVGDEWFNFIDPPNTFVVFSGTSPITSFIVSDTEYSGTSGTWIYEDDDEFWDNMGITAGTWTISGNTTTNVQSLIDSRYSFAGGDNSTAEGNVSFAYGYSARSEGDYSIAFGYNTVVEGDWGFAIGENTIAERDNSFVGGENSIAGAIGSFAFGNGVFADGSNSVAFGRDTSAWGPDSFACGRGTMAFGGRSFACGFDTQAGVSSGDISAFACGRNTKALEEYTFAGGRDTTVDARYSFIFSRDSLLTGERSVLLGGQNMTGDTDDTVYVPNLNIGTVGSGTSLFNLGIDSSGFVITGSSCCDLQSVLDEGSIGVVATPVTIETTAPGATGRLFIRASEDLNLWGNDDVIINAAIGDVLVQALDNIRLNTGGILSGEIMVTVTGVTVTCNSAQIPVAGEVLAAKDGLGNLEWIPITSGGIPGGSNTDIQWNNGGVFSGSSNLTWVESATTLTITGHLAATTKSFEIDHPTKEGKKLIHGSLEGPEHGVYVRGELKDDNIIVLPDYWKGLVDEKSITVQLTAIGRPCIHYVDEIIDYEVYVDCDNGLPHCYYFIQGERKDINKLQIEK